MSPEIKINHGLVEEKRPPLYRSMKYWGKKPHNVWRKYIETYTPENGVFLDACMGSGISVLEAVKAKRKAIGFDINPLSSFLIEVLTSDFSYDSFSEAVNEIVEEVEKDGAYQKYYATICPKCGSEAIAQNYKWENRELYEVGVECQNCKAGKTTRHLKKPDKFDIEKAESMENIKINSWYPKDSFPDSPSFTPSLIEGIGGNSFNKLWTRRNLYIFAEIFSRIEKEKDENLKQQLLLGFIQSLHLCTKMSVPRRGEAKRAFSTSWGRSAYLCSARQMEMNPLLVFKNNCLGRQSVAYALKGNYEYLEKNPQKHRMSDSNKSIRKSNSDIQYGTVGIQSLSKYVDEESVDYCMIDFPYGGLVQYLDLSLIWLVWLKKIDEKKYTVDLDAEITIKGKNDKDVYETKMLNGLRELYKVLKKDGVIVFTFHNKKQEIWNSFLRSIRLAGFTVEQMIHQQNRRTGEANVANPYGTSASDFYITVTKSKGGKVNTDKEQYKHFVVQKAIEIIALRNEPTPYQILFNGLLPEVSLGGYDIEGFDDSIESVLAEKIGDIFETRINGNKKQGNLWFFKNPDKYIKDRNTNLSDRVGKTIRQVLKRKGSATIDEVLREIFMKYPNGLTPDQDNIQKILEKNASKSHGKWIYKPQDNDDDDSEHSIAIKMLSDIGKRLGYEVFIGKREQSDTYKGKRLSQYADVVNLKALSQYNKETLKRLEMIDMLWLKDGAIEYAIEVENSTTFTSGIQRCSNIETEVPKIMVIPNDRVNEINQITDKMFIDQFKKQNWKYVTYYSIEKISKGRKEMSVKILDPYLKGLGHD